MADQQIVTSVVARSDFSDLIADVQRVTNSLSKLQQEFAGSNRALAGQIAATNAMFKETLQKTGQFSSHFVSLTSDVEKFGRNLDSGKLKLKDYFRVYQDHTRTHGGLIRDLAKQQVQLQNAVLQPLGRNAQGLMQYNVHIPRGLDLTKHKTSILKQELQIMNKVIQDGGVQLINWGKNTQWAGRQLTVGLTLPLVAFGKAAADAFKVADQELTRLTKVYGDIAGSSAQELSSIRNEVSKTAKELSSAMGVNFGETIALAADIAATGKTGNELLASVSETTRLAVLGEVDRQEAMKATLAIQSAFKQNTEELAESINFLNAVENQTSTTLNDLVEAIPKAGPVIKGLGGSIQDLALYLTAMREGGINASEGANALKSALASLINPTNVAVEKFQGFGIDLLGIVNKNAGNVTGTLLGLQSALDRLNPLQKQQAIEQLFGKFQYSRLNALFENLGRQGSQTLQVLDLMKASAGELEAVASRELTAVTESASGRYRRAIEGLKAELAGVGDEFLDIGTKLINVLTKIIDFGQKLPDPIKKLLAFGGAFTAILGPIIMLTGVLANFFGYIIKGLGHFKALFKGAEGFKLLTPEIMAARNAGEMLGKEFYSDAVAADTLRIAIRKLSEDLVLLQKNATSAKTAMSGVGQVVTTAAGSPIMTVGGTRVTDPNHPLVGGRSRAAAHMNPRDPNNPATIFGLTLQPTPVNRTIGRTPQILMEDRLDDIEGLTTIGGVSTGVVASEHARYQALMATLGLQSKREIAELKKTIRMGGSVSADFMATFDDILPITQDLVRNAATQSAAIVSELRAGKLSVQQARDAIIAVNAQLERDLGIRVSAYGAGVGRTIDLTKAPLIDQPVVDAAGKPNTRGMFRKGIFAKVMDALGRATKTKTLGGPYSIETTRPIQRNKGGSIPGYINGEFVYMTNGETVPGPNVNADVVPAMLTPGEFVLTRDVVAQQGSDNVRALHEGRAMIVPFGANTGGQVPGVQYLQNAGPVLAYLRQKAAHLVPRPMVATSLINRIWPGRLTTGAKSAFYEPKGNTGIFGGEFTDKSGKAWSTAKINKDMEGAGVPPKVLLSSIMSRNIGSRLSTDVFLDGLVRAGIISSAQKRALSKKVFSEYARTILSMGSVSDTNNPVWSVSNNVLRRELSGNPLALKFWDAYSRSPGSFAHPERRSSTGFLNRLTVDGVTANFANLEATGKNNKFYHTKESDNPLVSQINELIQGNQRPIAANRGGRVPGYFNGNSVRALPKSIVDRITKKWGNVYGGDSLSNDDPLHGPLQIGKFQPPRPTRVGRKGASIDYKRPGSSSNTTAFLTGSLEDRGRYVTQEYMLGNYDVLRIPGAIEAMKAWGRKATGKFYRGIRLTGFAGGGPKPLPDWLMDDIKRAQATGDFSNLIGKEFIMRRSSWSANPEIAKEFGTFSIVADVKNRRVTPVSEMFPEIGFAPKSAKTKQEKIKRARTEEESVFGGKFRIVRADKNGIELETAFDQLGGNRRFGGSVTGGTPYVVGENGPELFTPNQSGRIVPNFNRGGGIVKKGRGYYGDYRLHGGNFIPLSQVGGISRTQPMSPMMMPRGSGLVSQMLLGSLGFMGGQSLGSQFGQTGSMIGGTLGSILPMMLMGGMGGRGLGKGTPEALSFYQGKLDKSLVPSNKFTSSLLQKAAAGSKLSKVLMTLVGGLTKFNAITAGVTIALGAGIAIWKNYNKTQQLSAAEFGLTAENAEKAGLKFIDFNQKIKESVQAQKLFIKQNKLTYQSLASAGTPFKMTITEYKELKKQVKETMSTQIEMLNKTSLKDVNRVAVQLKTQFIAAGLSAEEAAKKVYTLFQLSNKASSTISALGTKDFNAITNAQTASVSALKSFNYAKTFESAKDQASALNTALNAINTSIEDTYKKAEKAAAKKKEDFDSTNALYEAEKRQLNFINSQVKNQAVLGEDVLHALEKQNPLIRQFANEQDTVVSLWQKMRIQARGYTGDLSNLNAKQTQRLYDLTIAVSKAVEDTNKKGLLKEQYKEYNRLYALQEKLARQAKGQSIKEQISTRDKLRAIDEEIKKINERADARKRELQEEYNAEDYQLELEKERRAYEQALATGDMAAAADAQLRIKGVVSERQRTLALDKIEADRVAQVTPLEEQKNRIQKDVEKLSDAAALAGESLESVTAKLDKQKGKIDKVNEAMTAFQLGLLTNAKNIKGLAGNFIDAVQKAGIEVMEYQYTGGAAGITKLDPLNVAKDLVNQFGAVLDKNLIAEGVTIESDGDIYINGKKVTTGSSIDRSADTTQFGTTFGPPLAKYEGKTAKEAAKNTGQTQFYKSKSGAVFRIFEWNGKTYATNNDGTEVYPFDTKTNRLGNRLSGGGKVSGPGTSTSDSIPAMLSDGEFVLSAKAVDAAGGPEVVNAWHKALRKKDGGPIGGRLGGPYQPRWGDLVRDIHGLAYGRDIWGGTEIPGLKFRGKRPNHSDYWHQMQEQPPKRVLGYGSARIAKDPIGLMGSSPLEGLFGGVGFGGMLTMKDGGMVKPTLGTPDPNQSFINKLLFGNKYTGGNMTRLKGEMPWGPGSIGKAAASFATKFKDFDIKFTPGTVPSTDSVVGYFNNAPVLLKNYFDAIKSGAKWPNLTEHPAYEAGGSLNALRAYIAGSNKPVGELSWDPFSGTVLSLNVDSAFRRKGLASKFWEIASGLGPISHSAVRSLEGDDWARAVGGNLPDLQHLVPKMAGGGYINPAYSANMSMPSYKTGVKYLYGDTIAKLHEKEAVLPEHMNPWNPTATNPIGGSTYYIQPTINAAPGMDEMALARMATDMTLKALENTNYQTKAKIGINRSR